MKKLESATDVETLRVSVRGKVQGVGFRMNTVRQAHRIGVSGWVRNLDDGSVEALIQGPHDRIDRMLSWLRVGPPAARVDDLESEEVRGDRHFDRFEQI